MLNYAATHRRTDKKPFGNNLSAAVNSLVDAASGIAEKIGGAYDPMVSSAALEKFVTPLTIDLSMGRHLPLCLATGTDHRVNSTNSPRG